MKSGNYCSKGVQKVARTLQDLLTISTPQIVIAKHHDRRISKVRPEYTLAAGVKGIAVDQGKDRLRLFHGCVRCTRQRPTPIALHLPSCTAKGIWGSLT